MIKEMNLKQILPTCFIGGLIGAILIILIHSSFTKGELQIIPFALVPVLTLIYLKFKVKVALSYKKSFFASGITMMVMSILTILYIFPEALQDYERCMSSAKFELFGLKNKRVLF